ncbi:MAG: zinc-binding dehydrogenase, partial [Actinomycetota bacterium]|nr:zinc-binding dehydrogenase [Actinomycetota bacterium]
ATGPGVDDFNIGDGVFGVVMKPELGDGGFGELVAAPAAFAAKVPEGLDTATAGALGLVGAAAHDAVEAVEPQRGDTVLVSGATGGVGVIAVQLLKARGAHVIATAATEEQIAFVRDHGADDVVDYRGDPAAAVHYTHPRGVDAVLHFAGDGARLAALVAPNGRLASTLGLSAEQLDRDDLTVIPVMANPATATLAQVADAVAAGTVRLPIARTYRLEDVPQGLADFAAGTLGKLAVRIQD